MTSGGNTITFSIKDVHLTVHCWINGVAYDAGAKRLLKEITHIIV